MLGEDFTEQRSFTTTSLTSSNGTFDIQLPGSAAANLLSVAWYWTSERSSMLRSNKGIYQAQDWVKDQQVSPNQYSLRCNRTDLVSRPPLPRLGRALAGITWTSPYLSASCRDNLDVKNLCLRNFWGYEASSVAFQHKGNRQHLLTAK